MEYNMDELLTRCVRKGQQDKPIVVYNVSEVIPPTVIITGEHYDDLVCGCADWYECPKCNNSGIELPFKFCPHCGVRLIWKE